ncbi:hypothetical protein [Caenimonas aquaedulcis]|uniref:DUF4893 domain-containing protein n=1 Tax=Caenimonas aquaedulcis TaxID=2793270 RepID=A0A931H8T5_9BURK|nr:hypothetical protein [Caenimonas aquaedulcis]MBG9390435.1 hypothetical protein [Caenimonas aquaedulcis]
MPANKNMPPVIARRDMRSPLLAIGMVMMVCATTASAQAPKMTAKQASPKQARATDSAPIDDLEFAGFAKDREFVGDPHEFASDETRRLWEHVVRVSEGTSEAFADMLKQGGDFAPVGGDCYLVRYAAIQITCMGSASAKVLTPWNAPGNTEVVSSRTLPDGRWWAIVKTGDLSHGKLSVSYHALFGARRAGRSVASSKVLAFSESVLSESARLCASGEEGSPGMESVIEAAQIESGPDADRAAFRVLRMDCRTGRATREKMKYRVSSTGVRATR